MPIEGLMDCAWVPVRCCCTPKKIFGFMRLPISGIEMQQYSLTDLDGVIRTLRFRVFTEGRSFCTPEFIRDAPPRMLREYSSQAVRETAIYSEEQPIEYWRNFKEFVEVNHEAAIGL